MARKNRIIFEGAIYHIYQRGNNHQCIFKDPKHKEFLIKQIKEYNRIFDFQLLSYVIMDNHYHLLIKTNKSTISEIMFNIDNVLGKYLNRELNRTGHVFEGRYNSKLVDTHAYLIWLLRYIHRNPIRANICSNLDDYRWSSHFFYKRGINNFINTNFILKILSKDKASAVNQYIKLVNNVAGNDSKVDFENTKEEFKLDDSKLLFEEDEVIKCYIKSLDEILNSLNIDAQIKSLIKIGSKKHNLTDYKIIFIKEALKNKYTLKEIGTFLNTSQPAISNLLSYYNISL